LEAEITWHGSSVAPPSVSLPAPVSIRVLSMEISVVEGSTGNVWPPGVALSCDGQGLATPTAAVPPGQANASAAAATSKSSPILDVSSLVLSNPGTHSLKMKVSCGRLDAHLIGGLILVRVCSLHVGANRVWPVCGWAHLRRGSTQRQAADLPPNHCQHLKHTLHEPRPVTDVPANDV
jgi:hypothetical protein